MPIDIFGSVKVTAIIALASASFTSPIVMNSDSFGAVSDRLSGSHDSEVATEVLVAGAYAFDMPETWGRISPSTVTLDDSANKIGTVVSAVCPGGSKGSACIDDVRIVFLSYAGKEDDTKLPLLTTFADVLDAELPQQLRGFDRASSSMKPGGDDTRWLRYEFTFTDRGAKHHEILGAFRHDDGSGVVAVATGPVDSFAKRSAAIDAFLASATEV